MTITKTDKIYRYLFFILFSYLSFSIIPTDSFAQGASGNGSQGQAENGADGAENTDALSQTLCRIVNKLTGPVGKGIAVIAMIVLGIGMFLGKLSWPVAVATAIGIGMIFGATSLVEWLGGTGAGVALCAG